jgi:hypothetical protein
MSPTEIIFRPETSFRASPTSLNSTPQGLEKAGRSFAFSLKQTSIQTTGMAPKQLSKARAGKQAASPGAHLNHQ